MIPLLLFAGGVLGLWALSGKRSAPAPPLVTAALPTREAFAPDDPPRAKVPQLRVPPRKTIVDAPHEVWRLTNDVRARGACGYAPAPPLGWSEKLAVAARRHAEDMLARGYFSHQSADGRSATDRITAAGFTTFPLGENIAEGQSSAAEVVDGWVHSPGHCKNLMGAGYRLIGVAYVPPFWVQNFGG